MNEPPARAAIEVLSNEGAPLDPSIDPLEQQLIQIWEKALGVKGIGVSDDFFDLGGDSLVGEIVFAAVRKWFGMDLPISTLLRAGTIGKLAAMIRAGGWSPDDQSLWALRLRGSKPAIYCVPAAGNEALSLRPLAIHMGEEQPFFTFQPHGFNGRQPCLRTVEEMAVQYIEILRRHQPKGPYCLCGYSFGGVVAFEMARRLVAEGEHVPFLGMFDTRGGDYPKVRKPLSLRKMVRLTIHRSIPLKENEELTWLHCKAAIRVAPRRWLLKLLVRFPMLPRPYELRRRYQREACLAARGKYRLQLFPGKIHMFRVAEREQPPGDLFEKDPYLGWGQMAAGGIEILNVPGSHNHQLREPYVRTLAAVLGEAVDKSHALEQR